DEEEFNPVNSTKDKDITYYSIGKINSSKSIQSFNTNVKPSTRIVSEPKISRHNLKKLSSYVKKSRILYISYTNSIDPVILAYIEAMALLNSTFVVYDYRFETSTKFGFQTNDDTTNVNQIRFLTNNKEFTLKKTLRLQREVLFENTFLFKLNFQQYINKDN